MKESYDHSIGTVDLIAGVLMVLCVFYLIYVVIGFNVKTNDREKVSSAVCATFLDATTEDSNEDLAVSIKGRSDIGGVNVEVLGESKNKFVIVKKRYLGLFEEEIYSEYRDVHSVTKEDK